MNTRMKWFRFLLWAGPAAALLFCAVWFLNADQALLDGLYRFRCRLRAKEETGESDGSREVCEGEARYDDVRAGV